MSEIDQQFVEYVVKSLVGKPDAVHIDRRVDEKGVLLELTVDPEDLGRVIGKRGATAQSLRTLLRALGTKNDARYNLKIIDNGVERPTKPAQDDDSQGDDSQDSQAADDQNPEAEPTKDEPKAAEPEAEAEPEQTPKPEEPESKEPGTSDRLAQTRQELADLDDLDL